jgi:phosphomannomutase
VSDETCDSAGKTPPSPDLLARVRAWVAADPDPVTRDELKQLIACDDGAAMSDRFDSALTFGTAGLRGALGAGPNRMNRVVVAHASAGFASYLRDTAGENPLVVIGRDARTNSDVFAEDAAHVFAGAGCDVLLIPDAVPTPVLAFAVRHLGAAAGVMVTASHNPAGDNGYKVYLGGANEGAQIVSPTDALILERIVAARRTRFADLPRGDFGHTDDSLLEAYVRATADVAPATVGEFPLVAYTPLHGVGLGVVTRVLAHAGFPALSVVPSQAEPDGSFPTVTFPNPEEDGALDQVIALGHSLGADLLLANDPDADRLAVCVPRGESYRMLSGNELGALLGWWAAEQVTRQGRTGTFATTLVSAPALERIAAKYGFDCVRTPSGFKWIGRVPHLIYGYEEALGYLVNPETIHDKDGISALVAVMSVASELHRQGSSIGAKVDELSRIFGGCAGTAFSVRLASPAAVTALMSDVRASQPDSLGTSAITHTHDYLPETNLVRWTLDDGAEALIRPSGTEPKLKVYVYADEQSRAEALAAEVRALISSLT